MAQTEVMVLTNHSEIKDKEEKIEDDSEEYFRIALIILKIPKSTTGDQLTPEQVMAIRKFKALDKGAVSQEKSLGRAHLKPETRIILWALAVYVVLMLLLIYEEFQIGVHQ